MPMLVGMDFVLGLNVLIEMSRVTASVGKNSPKATRSRRASRDRDVCGYAMDGYYWWRTGNDAGEQLIEASRKRF